MKNKSYSIPYGMIFKKYYCSCCGQRLVKSRTHRVVSSDDLDYYQYHKKNTFPRNNVDVYDYQFKCNVCHRTIAYSEQCIIERIQKKYHKKILRTQEIKDNYQQEQNKEDKKVLKRKIFIALLFINLMFILRYIFYQNKSEDNLIIFSILYVIMVIYIIYINVRNHYGKSKLKRNRDYSNLDKMKLEKLHSYASNNKKMIEESEYCYCFHCMKKMNSNEITNYLENENTALCPYCSIDSIIPDNIDEKIDDKLLYLMNKYWF